MRLYARPAKYLLAFLLAYSAFSVCPVTALAEQDEDLKQQEVCAVCAEDQLVAEEEDYLSDDDLQSEQAVGLADEAEENDGESDVALSLDDEETDGVTEVAEGELPSSDGAVVELEGEAVEVNPIEEQGEKAEDENETELSGETSAPAITKSGWNQSEDGTWYWSDDGKTAASGWKSVKGVWYYLDPTTFAMKAAEAFEAAGKTYVARASGACPASSWVELVAGWYLTDASCAVRSGWAKSGSSWYYLDPQTYVMKESEVFEVSGKVYVATVSGACPASKWVKLDGEWYLTDSSCAARSGWVQSSGNWYYLDSETRAMKAGEQFKVSGKTYIAQASGICPASSWVKLGADWFLTNASCAVRTGWASSSRKWYYLDPSESEDGLLGKMLTGYQDIDGSLYLLNAPNGDMVSAKWLELENGTVAYASVSGEINKVPGATLKNGKVSITGEPGWNQIGEQDYYYINEDGSVYTGWLKSGSTWYYLDPSSLVMSRSTIVTVGGTPYVFAKSGAWIDITGDSALNKRIATIMRDKTGLDLRECYEYVWRNYGYRSMGYWPSYANWQADYARQMLDNGSGNCYAYAALFQFMAKACDADTKLIKGWAISKTSGKHTPHGWVEYYVDGQTYIIDPEISYEAKMNVFFKFKYSDCEWIPGIYYAYGKAGDTNLTILK